ARRRGGRGREPALRRSRAHPGEAGRRPPRGGALERGLLCDLRGLRGSAARDDGGPAHEPGQGADDREPARAPGFRHPPVADEVCGPASHGAAGRARQGDDAMNMGEKTRRDFPILSRVVNGHPPVFLATAPSSQKPTRVIGPIARYYERSHANVHRSIHTLGEEATELYEAARDAVRAFIGAGSREEVVFTRGTTESLNLV